jgi:hypothetical protein
MIRTTVILGAFLALLASSAAHAQSGKPLTVGERTVTIAIPAGYSDLAELSESLNAELMSFVGEGETALMAIVDANAAQLDPNWQLTSVYAIVSVIDNSVPGTTSPAEFAAQFDFLANGLTDVSRLSLPDAAALVADALGSGASPPHFNPASRLAIESVQVLEISDRRDLAGAITFLHPTAENALLVTDLGLVDVNGQMIKIAAYAFLNDAGTIDTLQALGKAIRDGTLAAN